LLNSARQRRHTVYYNLRHGRHGHLLDGRYKAKRDVADYLHAGVGSSISKQLAGLPDKLTGDRKLRRSVKQLDERFCRPL